MEIGELTVRIAADAEPLRRGIEEAQLSLRGFDRSVGSSFESLAGSLTRYFGSGISSGKSIGDMLKSALINWQAGVAQQLVNALSLQAFGGGQGGGSFGGGLMDWIGGGISSIFGGIFGSRATGGSVAAGQTMLVGECGPELFTPFTGGMVTANNHMNNKGNSGIQITMNIATPDAGSFRYSQGQIVAEMASTLKRAQRNL